MVGNSMIVDINGNPIAKRYADVVAHSQQTMQSKTAYLYNEFAGHPSSRITPAKLVPILIEAEQGNICRQAELFTDIEEKDGQIFADMDKRKRAILTLKYRVIPVKNATPIEESYAHYISEILDELDCFDDLLIDMLDAIGQGFSNVEIAWKRFGKEWHPDVFSHRPASWFEISKNDQNHLLLRTEDGEGQELRRFNWITHIHKSRSGYIARAGLMRTLAWPYIYRQFGIQSLAELLDIYGIPIRIGKFPAGTSEKDRNTLMRAVNEIGRHAGAIVPEAMNIEIINAVSGSSEPFMAMNDWAEKTISKIILGATLTSQADGKSSTNALGQIHNEIRKDILESDARQIAQTLRRDLFYPMIFFNLNPAVDPRRVPRIEFYDEDAELEQEEKRRSNAGLRYKSALKSNPNTLDLRTMIDDAVTKRQTSGVMGDYIVKLLEPILPEINNTTSEDELVSLLSSFFPDMSINDLQHDLSEIANITQMLSQAEPK